MTLLLDSGIDIHNFSPTAQDIVKVAEADLFIYIGGESDKWVDRVVATSQNKNLKTINFMEIQKNANAFIEKLDALDKKYIEAAKNKKYDTVVFGDRFPFRYLVDDYGLKYF